MQRHIIEITPIESLGHAKNNIVDVKLSASDLPAMYKRKLSRANALLNEVQEFLFNN